MLGYKAFSINGTWILIEAWIYTIFASAYLALGTLRIFMTPENLARFEWISFIAGNTPTHGFVVGWVAFGKSTTGVLNNARVDTVTTIGTHLSVSAVIVTLASQWLLRCAGHKRVTYPAWRTDAPGIVALH